MSGLSPIGWRAFAVDDAGRLVAPFVRRYWPELAADHAWPAGEVTAACLSEDHEAPAAGCTCGIRATAALLDLLRALERKFAGSSLSILHETGVLAKVQLFGRRLPGVNMPEDDPPMTQRGERARILEVHVAPCRSEHAAAIEAFYSVPVTVWTPADWPKQVGRPKRAPAGVRFLAEVREAGFGRTRVPDKVLEKLARDAIDAMRGGVPAGDIATVLFESPAQPTVDQAQAFVEAAIRAFAPELEFVDRGAQFSGGVDGRQAWRRAIGADRVGVAYTPMLGGFE